MKRFLPQRAPRALFAVAGALLVLGDTTPCALLRAADQKWVNNDVDHPKPGTPIDAEKLRRLAWGPAATNGLRAACYFEPTKEAYEDGAVVKRWTVYHNRGKRPVIITVAIGGNNDQWSTVDGQGRGINQYHVLYLGEDPWVTCRLEPGQATEVECRNAGLGESAHASDVIEAEPGMVCRVKWVLRVYPSFRVVGDKGVRVADSWDGELTTGELSFRVVGKNHKSEVK